jgi:alkanesulfonate monooxygenase SsuD/methylene tetrahydromethanopterin reductase-like flavin-dependent oxidoreductase (luciferase family)
MEIGSGFIFQNTDGVTGDRQFMTDEMRLCVLSEELGFDFIGLPEHHFSDYSMSVDPVQLLTWIAARTSEINLMTAVVVLPWHDPLRVIERCILLDHLSDGRLWLGVGRGFAAKEYNAFRIDREEARGRFDEAAEFIKNAVESGIAELDGQFYKQPRVEIRPRPFKSFADRFYSVANSPASAELAGRIGARMVMFVMGQLDQMIGHVDIYRSTYRETQGTEPPPVQLTDSTFCTRDPELAAIAREQWYPDTWQVAVNHYEFDTTDFSKVKGYEAHARLGEASSETSVSNYASTQVWGTPEEIVEKYKKRVEVLGDVDTKFVFRWGGMPVEAAEASMRLFAAEALPELKKLGSRATATVGGLVA